MFLKDAAVVLVFLQIWRNFYLKFVLVFYLNMRPSENPKIYVIRQVNKTNDLTGKQCDYNTKIHKGVSIKHRKSYRKGTLRKDICIPEPAPGTRYRYRAYWNTKIFHRAQALFPIRIRIDLALLDPDPYLLGMRIRVRIQEKGNWPKLRNKPDFQPFKMAFVRT